MARCTPCVEKKLRQMIKQRDTEIKQLEAEVERLEAQLKIAARDYAAVCDYPLAPSEALESWEYEALKEAGNE